MNLDTTNTLVMILKQIWENCLNIREILNG